MVEGNEGGQGEGAPRLRCAHSGPAIRRSTEEFVLALGDQARGAERLVVGYGAEKPVLLAKGV